MRFKEYPRQDRVKTPRHHIDPGFINHRLIFSTLGHEFRVFYEVKRIKAEDHMAQLWNDHLLVTYLLTSCHNSRIKTLGEVLHYPAEGELFCSTEEVAPNSEVYDKERTRSKVILPYEYNKDVVLEYSTRHIVSDTGRSELHQGAYITVVAGIRRTTDLEVIAHPLVMGAPSFDHPLNKDLGLDLLWHGWDWYEIFPGDVDEFIKIGEIPEPSPEEWQAVMSRLPEQRVKEAICELLNDEPKKDWGGELNDHFTSAMHLSGQRVTAAFLLKGPARFEEMKPSHLGKNADQIYRLSMSPADLLIVQHSHSIGEAVRATLRAFAVNPASPRRYCLLDGKDTYKLLKAYGKLVLCHVETIG